MSRTAIELPRAIIEDFCRRWKITELALVDSVLRDDFGPEGVMHHALTDGQHPS
jgi:hypothetical protein